MNNVRFLSYLSDPFGIGSAKFISCDQGAACIELSTEELSQYEGPLVTYDAWMVVDELRRAQKTLPPNLIDIGEALRLGSGLAKDQGGERRWDVFHALQTYIPSEADQKAVRALVQARQCPPDEQEVLRLLTITCQALAELWQKVLQDLKDNGEHDRFLEIEIPVQQVFWHRQHKGIRIDAKHAGAVLESVRNEKYSAFREVAEILGFSPAGLTFANVGEFLAKTDAHHLAEFSDWSSLQEYFRIAQHTSRFAHAFVQYIRASQDLSILKRACGSGERVYPLFHPFGTVTGRVLVSEPRLQELRKKYRPIIIADHTKRLFYLDYGQFEPGILAAFAEDADFIKRYNTTDIYTALSKALFGTETERGLCKRIFLGFCYGMKQENIAKLLAGADASMEELSKYEHIVLQFFNAFPKLAEYKQSLQADLLRDGHVSTVFGNHRRRSKTGNLSFKEARWAISQKIQGSASLIFKEAIIGLAKEFGPDSIVLPMHDAVLMQFDDSEQVPDAAIHIMEQAFKKWTQGTEPKVVVGAWGR